MQANFSGMSRKFSSITPDIWALAMQIIGSFTPNSAAAERVFSLLKLMFGNTQMSALAYMIQSALMFRYNQHKVG